MSYSPMMQQYFEIKKHHQDHILFFRLGDFYEMFFNDATLASKELELTLTGRDCGGEERAPMCGVPYHSAESYIARLVKKGYKVAICEQMENPAETKGMVRREVVRVVTPGTVVENSMLDEDANNYLASVYVRGSRCGVAFCDVSTGDLQVTEVEAVPPVQLINELSKFHPSEILFNDELLDLGEVTRFIKEKLNASINIVDQDAFEHMDPQLVPRHFGASLEDLGLDQRLLAAGSLRILLDYLHQTQRMGLERIGRINFYSESQFVNLDISSRRNLELTETMRTHEKRGSLLWVLDKTKTAMGKRLMRSTVEQPFVNPVIINKRLEAVETLYKDGSLRGNITDALSSIFDLERLMTRIVFGNANPREYKSLQSTAEKIPALKNLLAGCKEEYLRNVYEQMDSLADIADRIRSTIRDEAPVTLKEGGVIEDGANEELDQLRDIVKNSRDYLTRIEGSEKEKTGIKTLKIGFNRVFGYYLEVSKSYAGQVPKEYIRKQTLANCERYITEELKLLEEKILGAHERIVVLEQKIFEELRQYLSAQIQRVQTTANAVARLDLAVSFANVAVKNSYVRPEVDLSDRLEIQEGRHPVVEEILTDVPFVPNDTYLDCKDHQIAIITGPNMAGKSTYMRQTAVIALMAQIGSFVPAKYARIGVLDGIYTRVGASDDLASGQSTFMVEMSEVASILKSATPKSLLILDEIGRGTSTFDGMSIARAVLEYIADKKKLGAKTMFATHYHELTDLEKDLPNVKNYNIAVKKRGDEITFLRRIVPGGTDDSFGIEVSKLSGIPTSIINRAHAILQELEEQHPNQVSPRPSGVKRSRILEEEAQQLTLAPLTSPAEEKLKSVDENTLTPIEALNLIYELKKLIRD